MPRICLYAALAGCSAIAMPALAQTEFVLPPMVVSPTEIPTPPSQLGSDVSVITAADIERNQWRTLPDALAAVPGLVVEQSGGPGTVASVFIRGTNANHTLVLIDGVDVSNPASPDGSFDFSQVQISDVARIEVLRGPQSGLYGSQAIGGVILIETKKGEGPPHLTGTVEGGSFGTFNQTGGFSGSSDKVNYAFNVQHFHSNDTPVTPLDLLPPGVPRHDDLYDNVTVSTRLGADLSPMFGTSLIARYTDSMLNFQGADDLTALPAAQQSEQFEQQFYTRGDTRITLLDGAFDNHIGIAYTDDHQRELDPTAPEIGENPVTVTIGQRVAEDWKGKYVLAPDEKLLFGFDAEQDSIINSPISASNGDQGGFIEWQGRIAGQLFGQASVRYDHNDQFGSAVTWHVAPSYTLPGWGTQLKASAGTGFKAPTLNQLFVSLPAFNFFANPHLQPERSLGFDVGFEQPVWNNRLRFGATYFYNDIHDLIDDNATFTTLINIGHATTQGAETFVTYAVTPTLDLRADYTYTLAMDDDTGTELERRPKHKASLTASWRPIARLTLAATAIYVGTREDVNFSGTAPTLADPYYLINLSASYQVTPSVAVFARINNLLNEHYEDIVGFLRPGLGVFAGVNVAFDAKGAQ